MRAHRHSRLINATTGLRVAPWILAATAATAIAIMLALAPGGSAQATTSCSSTNFNMTLRGWNTNIDIVWNSRNGHRYRYKFREALETNIGTLEQQIAGQGDWSEWRELEQIPEERHTHTITGLTAGKRYMIELQCRSYLWAEVDIQLARTKPAAPQNLQYTMNSDNDVTLTWDAPLDPSIQTYWYRATVGEETGTWVKGIDLTEDPPPSSTTSMIIEADELTAGADNSIDVSVRSPAGSSWAFVTVSVPDEAQTSADPDEEGDQTPAE